MWFFVAVIIGSLITTATVLLFKKNAPAAVLEGEGVTTELSDEQDTRTNITQTKTEPVHADTNTQETKEDTVFHKSLIELTNSEMKRDDVIDRLITELKNQNYVEDFDQVKSSVLKRESESTTAIGMNVAIPHAKSDAVKQPVVAVLQNKNGIEWESLDGSLPKIVFLIVVPNNSNDTHLKLLQRLSKTLMDDETRGKLINAEDKETIYDILKAI